MLINQGHGVDNFPFERKNEFQRIPKITKKSNAGVPHFDGNSLIIPFPLILNPSPPLPIFYYSDIFIFREPKLK